MARVVVVGHALLLAEHEVLLLLGRGAGRLQVVAAQALDDLLLRIQQRPTPFVRRLAQG